MHLLVLLLWMRHTPLAMHPTPLCIKLCCPQGQTHLSEGLRADAIIIWSEVVILRILLSLYSQAIPIYQGMVPFIPMRIYIKHDMS